jgi:hypothetical protein
METLWNAGLSARTAAPCRLRLATASLLTIALLLGLGADSAKAGAYKMYSCNVPGRSGPVLSAAPWRALLTGPQLRVFDRCSTGGGLV